jgi:hypothetical protein
MSASADPEVIITDPVGLIMNTLAPWPSIITDLVSEKSSRLQEFRNKHQHLRDKLIARHGEQSPFLTLKKRRARLNRQSVRGDVRDGELQSSLKILLQIAQILSWNTTYQIETYIRYTCLVGRVYSPFSFIDGVISSQK